MTTIKNNQQGFIWQELVIALAFFGVIFLVSGLLLHNCQQKSRDIKRLADISMIQHALELYYYNCNVYPASIIPSQSISGVKECQSSIYLQYVPVDPSGQPYQYVPCQDSTFRECKSNIKKAGGYQLYYELESNIEGVARGRHIAVPGKLVAQ